MLGGKSYSLGHIATYIPVAVTFVLIFPVRQSTNILHAACKRHALHRRLSAMAALMRIDECHLSYSHSYHILQYDIH